MLNSMFGEARSYHEIMGGIKLFNNHGSALITAMISALSVGVVSAIILQQSQVTEKQTRVPRIKSAMLVTETQLREALDTQAILKDCTPADPSKPNCKIIDTDKISKMKTIIPGANCPTNDPCGIELTNVNFDNGTLTARIVYKGEEVVVAPVNISMTLNTNLDWQNQTSNCDSSQPLLTGFDQAGNKICKKLPDGCPAGSYIKEIDPMSITTGGFKCEEFPPTVSCPAGQIISAVSWKGGIGGLIHNCAAVLSPFSPAALNDPTSYSYASSSAPSVSAWPTTTTSTTTTTTTSTTTTTMGGKCFPRILFPYSGGPGMNCTASPLPDDCTSMGACSTDGQVLIHPYLGCANVACVCRCLGPTTTTTLQLAGCPPGKTWQFSHLDSFGQSDDVCKLPLCSNVVGKSTQIGKQTGDEVLCVNSAPGACCSSSGTCAGNHRVFTCQ